MGDFALEIPLDRSRLYEGAALAPSSVPEAIVGAFVALRDRRTAIDPDAWSHSRYFPVPTIIEAASAIYANHDVKDLAYSRAGAKGLERTQAAISEVVGRCRDRGEKALVLVTGVPGAGKTLAGLNAVQQIQRELDATREQAAFLSGNAPLVRVLQRALKRSAGVGRREAANAVESRVREVHRFVHELFEDPRRRPPAARLVVFDEAQRAWTAARNEKKFGRPVSEPEMMLEIMGRHEGWAVVVALIGGGQEIHGGEAGVAAWGDAVARARAWNVLASPEALRGGPGMAGSTLFRETTPAGVSVSERSALHLELSVRSFEAQTIAAWVNALLSGEQEKAAALARDGFPVWATRDLRKARNWLKAQRGGVRRAGLIASSGAARLRADGVEPPTFSFLKGIDYGHWFLLEDDHRSSNQLEVALSEFEMQGLEIDLAGLLWGGDLIFPNGRPTCRRFGSRGWGAASGCGDVQVGADDPVTRIKNKYRVLLTRFRKAMVIFVPVGDDRDPTGGPAEFDDVWRYLLWCGVRELD